MIAIIRLVLGFFIGMGIYTVSFYLDSGPFGSHYWMGMVAVAIGIVYSAINDLDD